MKSLHVTVPCSFTSDSNEGMTEATGWSTSIHPSIHRAGQAPTFDTLGLTRDAAMWWQTPWLCRQKAILSLCLKMHQKFLQTNVDSAFLHLCPLQWRHPWGSWKRIEHDVIASRSACKADYVSVLWYTKYAPVSSVYYDVIGIKSVIQWVNPAATHL